MIHIKAKAQKRGVDPQGSGAFGAPRRDHTHHGIDYACEPGSAVFSPVIGVVTKLGYPYAHDLSFRYVEVTTEDGLRHRVFYVFPTVMIGETVGQDSVIGFSQRLPYRGMTQHVHYEVMDIEGKYIDPESI